MGPSRRRRRGTPCRDSHIDRGNAGGQLQPPRHDHAVGLYAAALSLPASPHAAALAALDIPTAFDSRGLCHVQGSIAHMQPGFMWLVLGVCRRRVSGGPICIKSGGKVAPTLSAESLIDCDKSDSGAAATLTMHGKVWLPVVHSQSRAIRTSTAPTHRSPTAPTPGWPHGALAAAAFVVPRTMRDGLRTQVVQGGQRVRRRCAG